MMLRAALGGIFLTAALSSAPLQCRREPSRELRREDSAGDALYELAMDFRAQGKEQAARDTLRYLVERYPSNRRAESARVELRRVGADAAEGRSPSPP